MDGHWKTLVATLCVAMLTPVFVEAEEKPVDAEQAALGEIVTLVNAMTVLAQTHADDCDAARLATSALLLEHKDELARLRLSLASTKDVASEARTKVVESFDRYSDALTHCPENISHLFEVMEVFEAPNFELGAELPREGLQTMAVAATHYYFLEHTNEEKGAVSTGLFPAAPNEKCTNTEKDAQIWGLLGLTTWNSANTYCYQSDGGKTFKASADHEGTKWCLEGSAPGGVPKAGELARCDAAK